MGITMRGGGNGHHVHGAYRRRWNVYVWMMIIAMLIGFGILLGVMGLHSIKHKRSLNLLIQDKDAQILSTHLLLQKEREHTEDIKAKTEEIRIKMYNLRARNAELKSKISDLHSTISSLRDDQSTVELHSGEKQNEAKLALTEVTQRKEAEIEDLKHHLQLCANTNEPSIALANKTAKENVPRIERAINQGQEHDASKADNEKNEYENDKTADEEGNNANFTSIKEFATTGNADSGQISNSSQEIDSRELGTQENSKDERFRFGGKRGYVKRTKGKKWKRATAKQTVKRGKSDKIGSNLKSQQFGMYDHKQLEENNREKVKDSPPDVKLENNTKALDTEYTSVKLANDDMSESDDEHINSRGWLNVFETNEDPGDEDRTTDEP